MLHIYDHHDEYLPWKDIMKMLHDISFTSSAAYKQTMSVHAGNRQTGNGYWLLHVKQNNRDLPDDRGLIHKSSVS